MAVYFQANSIADPAARGIIQQAILEAVEGLPGEWFVEIGEIAHSPAWEIEITGPNNFFWKRIFFGHQNKIAMETLCGTPCAPPSSRQVFSWSEVIRNWKSSGLNRYNDSEDSHQEWE